MAAETGHAGHPYARDRASSRRRQDPLGAERCDRYPLLGSRIRATSAQIGLRATSVRGSCCSETHRLLFQCNFRDRTVGSTMNSGGDSGLVENMANSAGDRSARSVAVFRGPSRTRTDCALQRLHQQRQAERSTELPITFELHSCHSIAGPTGNLLACFLRVQHCATLAICVDVRS